MEQMKLIPELNYWINIVLTNSPLKERFFDIPVSVLEKYGFQQDSVLNILFNETYASNEISSSSCRAIPINLYNGVTVLQRVSSSSAIEESSSTSIVSPMSSSSSINIPLELPNFNIQTNNHFNHMYRIADRSKIDDYNMKQRTIMYIKSSDIYVLDTASNCDLFKLDLNGDPFLAENIFNLTEEELYMIDLIYHYKSEMPVALADVPYNLLESELSKCIFVYLEWELYETLTHFNNLYTKGSSLLCTIYEKYLNDYIYRVISSQYYITHTSSQDNIDRFLKLNYDFRRIKLTVDQVMTRRVDISDSETPYHVRDSYIIHNGKKLIYDKNYKIIVNNDLTSYITWDHNNFQVADELFYFWSFLEQEQL